MCEVTERFIEMGLELGMEQGIERGIEQGIEQGREQNKIETIYSSIKEGLPIDLIARITALTIEEVEKILESKE